MNKIIIAGAVVVVGAGAVILSQQNSNQSITAPTYNVLEYIPADTPVFAGQFEPFPLKDYIASAPKMIVPNDQQAMDESSDPGVNFMLSLFQTYEAGLADADLLIKTFGLPEDVRAYFYTLGLLPVFKIEIANEQAIWDLLDKTELETGFTHKEGTLETISYRAYPISDETDPVNAEMIVTIDNGLLTVTMNSAYHEETLLAQALGLTKAEKSLAASGAIEEIIKKHQLNKASIGFINHIELLKGLTTVDGNQLAKQITSLQEKLGDDGTLTELRSAQCASEFAAIANNWPRTVAGYTQLDITAQESTVAVSTIIESKNTAILNALSAVRGYIPNYINDINNNVIAMGLGFDVNKLTPSLNAVWSDLQTPSYTCQPLAEMQAEITQSGEMIGMAGMSASMANGVQGISLGVLDYTVTNMDTSYQLDTFDALFTISAANPIQLFISVKMFMPELQLVQLSDGGEAISLSSMLPIPSELNLDPKLAIKGNHLVIYNGEKGEQAANALTSETLSQNGLYSMGFDFKKMVTPMITATELSGETIPEEMMFLTEYDARMQMSIDINEQGLIFKSKINNKAPK